MMHTKSERTEIIKMLIVSQLIASFSLIASHHGNYDCYITTQAMTIVITFQVDYKLNKQICEITTIYEIEKPFSAFHVTDPFPHESSHRNSLLRKLVYCNNFDFSFGEIQNHIFQQLFVWSILLRLYIEWPDVKFSLSFDSPFFHMLQSRCGSVWA